MTWIDSLPDIAAVHAFDDIDSTNTCAKKLAAEGAPHLTLVIAKRQSAGRGRTGREWVSPEGNVFWTMLLRPSAHWPPAGTLPFVAALSVHKALAALTRQPDRLRIKWPNDTLLDGKKISGILQEGEAQAAIADDRAAGFAWVVVGIGINVAQHPGAGTLYPTTSLNASGFTEITRDQVIRELTRHYCETLTTWVEGGFAALRGELLRHMAGIGAPIRVRRGNNPDETLDGIFEGLDGEGHLIMRLGDGTTKEILVGDVFLN